MDLWATGCTFAELMSAAGDALWPDPGWESLCLVVLYNSRDYIGNIFYRDYIGIIKGLYRDCRACLGCTSRQSPKPVTQELLATRTSPDRLRFPGGSDLEQLCLIFQAGKAVAATVAATVAMGGGSFPE